MNLVAIFIGGGLGSLCRYGIGKLLVVTGFCGGFSTFSTFSFETFEMLKNGQTALAFANVFVSVFLCLFVLYIIYKKSII